MIINCCQLTYTPFPVPSLSLSFTLFSLVLFLSFSFSFSFSLFLFRSLLFFNSYFLFPFDLSFSLTSISLSRISCFLSELRGTERQVRTARTLINSIINGNNNQDDNGNGNGNNHNHRWTNQRSTEHAGYLILWLISFIYSCVSYVSYILSNMNMNMNTNATWSIL